jgi:hypothetical protein
MRQRAFTARLSGATAEHCGAADAVECGCGEGAAAVGGLRRGQLAERVKRREVVAVVRPRIMPRHSATGTGSGAEPETAPEAVGRSD